MTFAVGNTRLSLDFQRFTQFRKIFLIVPFLEQVVWYNNISGRYERLQQISRNKTESEVSSNVLLTAVPLETRACLSRAEQHDEILLMWKALSTSSLSI